MNVIYLGTPEFAVLPLKRIVESKKYNVIAVITNRDKPIGRKQTITPCPVKEYAVSQNIQVFQYDKISVEGVKDLKRLKPDLMITCAFGQILSQEILQIPSLYTLNIHASLLPKYRGASPIHFAILNGEKETGVTIMKTDVGIDTGDILISRSTIIDKNETMGELFTKLSSLGADLIMDALKLVESKKAIFVKQDNSKATFSKIIKKEMARIDFSKNNYEVVNQIRAFNPSPVAFTMLENQPFKVYEATSSEKEGKVGEVLENDKKLTIACKKGSVELLKVQKAGGNPMNIIDFLRGKKIEKGFVFPND